MNTLVPPDQLRPATLIALIEDFVTRDGAIHGHHDTPLPQMVETIRGQLWSGQAVIVFDEEDGSWTIMSREEFKRRGT
jgi:uncharacterized protein